MHPEQIKAAIRMAGSMASVIADELEISRSTVAQVISGRGTSARVQARISEVTGLPVATLWPAKPVQVLRRASPAKKPAAAGRRDQERRTGAAV